MHDYITYPELKGKINHLGNDEDQGGWQNHSKHAWFMTDQGVKTKYKEYWNWLAWLDQEINEGLLINSGSMAIGNIKPIAPYTIDF
jgi:hypothetical protein